MLVDVVVVVVDEGAARVGDGREWCVELREAEAVYPIIGSADANIELSSVSPVLADVGRDCLGVASWSSASSGPPNAAKRDSTVILDVMFVCPGVLFEEEGGEDDAVVAVAGVSLAKSLSSSDTPPLDSTAFLEP